MAFVVIVKSRQMASAALMRLNFCVWQPRQGQDSGQRDFGRSSGLPT